MEGTEAILNVMASEPNDSHLYGLIDRGTQYILRLPNSILSGYGTADGFGGSWGTLVAEYSTPN